MIDLLAPFGAAPSGERRARIARSPNYRDGKFQNPVKTTTVTAGLFLHSMRRQFFGDEQRVPLGPIPVVSLPRGSFEPAPASGLRVTWMGHSSMLIEIDGYRILVDPVWSRRASPSELAGPERFHAPPVALADLPPLDAVIITHDHYDHLDMHAVEALTQDPSRHALRWITTLGVGAHLERWGVGAGKIAELDWSDSARVGELVITAEPARHFSGRTLRACCCLSTGELSILAFTRGMSRPSDCSPRVRDWVSGL